MRRLMLLVLTALLMTAQAQALEFPCDGTADAADALLWAEPGAEQEPVLVAQGTSFRVVGEIEFKGEQWYQVEKADGSQGYLREEHLSIADTKGIEAAGADQTMMKVTVKAECADYNHVGKEWTQHCKVNGLLIDGVRQDIAVAPGIGLALFVKIVEHDKYCDVGVLREVYVPTAEEAANGFKLTRSIEVREGSGRYAGCIAVWTVELVFEPMQ